jgi:hypothetical protein
MPSDVPINLKDYEEIPEIVSYSSWWLIEIWEKLGKPDSPLSDAGVKVMNVILTVWQELYPDDYNAWIEDRKKYKLNEMTISDQIRKHTGRSLASYPLHVFMMMKVIFPQFKPGQRENCLKMVKKFPIFQFANKS